MDEEDGDKWRMEMDEEYGDEWVRVKDLGFRDRV